MVIGDSSSRGQASELLAVLTACLRHDANLPGIFGALCPTTKRPMRNETRGRGEKEEHERKRKKRKGDRVCFYATCSAKPDSSFLSERHNYAVIARSFFI